MQHVTLRLDLTQSEWDSLNTYYEEVVQHLEQREPLSTQILEKLKAALTDVVTHSPEWQEILQQVHHSGDYFCLRLMHEDNLLLNLPWSMAVDGISGQSLGSIHNLYLGKSVSTFYKETEPDHPLAPAPLKILIMVSSPEDGESIKRDSWKKRLSYEAEELAILEAFEPLLQKGQVEIDFTPNGSLAALKEKLKENHYHILHYTGHAAFDQNKNVGLLQLEDELTLASQWVTDQEFAAVVNCDPDYRVPLVVLASCQTAQGTVDMGLRGVTNQLLRIGVPLVVSMGLSIKDYYATYFTARFYQALAKRETLFAAFQQAITQLQQKEQEDLKSREVSPAVPLQWLIPNLYVSRPLVKLVAWDKAEKGLQLKSSRYLFHRERLLLEHESTYCFIGRRRDKARVLGPFLNKTPVLIKGQGGVGKTALAEHLVQRLIAADPKTQPFVLDETNRSLDVLLKAMQKFLRANGSVQVLAEVSRYEKALDQFAFLAFAVAKIYQPVFVLDNLESFQVKPGEGFADEYADIQDLLNFLCDDAAGQFHVVLTCRYPVAGLKGVLEIDLNQVGFNDFLRRCYGSSLKNMARFVQTSSHALELSVKGYRGPTFIEIVRRLFDTLGGNYRMLEFFTGLVSLEPEKLPALLDSLETFERNMVEPLIQARQQMRENLLFSHLFSMLTVEQQRVLRILSFFRVPVMELALRQQGQSSTTLEDSLSVLNRLTLLETSKNLRLDKEYYYVTPLIKDLLSGVVAEPEVIFNHDSAGQYFENVVKKEEGGVTEFEEAFYHYDLAGTKVRIAEIGNQLSYIYNNYSLFHNALYYAMRVYEHMGEETEPVVLNRLGQIYFLQGNYDEALQCFSKAHTGLKTQGDKKGEGSALNNIGQIFKARGDYAIALSYLKQSLSISLELDDKAGEGAILNNISQIYAARSDYAGALSYLEQGLVIMQKLGDKAGECTTLNNISQIFHTRGDYVDALSYLEKSLTICREIGDKLAEGRALNNISHIYSAQGDYDGALFYLHQSLTISREIGTKAMEGKTLNNIGQVFLARGDYAGAQSYLEQSLVISREITDKSAEGSALDIIGHILISRGDYANALSYLEQSLTIRREIGDKAGEGTTLNNISQVYSAYGDNASALSYLKQGLSIMREIGEKACECATLNNIGQIYSARGDYDEALSYLEQSLSISKEIGNKLGEARTLNNISLICSARSDFLRALSYLEPSLVIMREIGDRAGESTTLNNISHIYSARRDYAGALFYLEQSLAIAKEISDQKGISYILHNIAMIAFNDGNMEKFLAYESEAYDIATQINDAMGIYNVNKELGFALAQAGLKEQGLSMLYRSLEIGKSAGFPDVGEVEEHIQIIESGDLYRSLASRVWGKLKGLFKYESGE